MFNSLKIPVTFLVAGMCWVVFGNSLITALTTRFNLQMQDQFRNINDVVFVIITAIVLYILIKKQQNTLRKSEEEYRQLFESNHNPMWIYNNTTFRFVKVNTAAVETYGYSKKRFLRMTIFDIRPAEEKEKLREHLKEHNDQVRVAGIWQHTKASGTVFTVSIISHPVTFNDQSCSLVMATDITENLEKERKLQDAYQKIKTANDTLLQTAWANSHKVRKPLCSIIGLIDLLKLSVKEEERKELLNMLEVSATELDHVSRKNNEKVSTSGIQEVI